MTTTTTKSMIYLPLPKEDRVNAKFPRILKEGLKQFQEREKLDESKSLALAVANFLKHEGILNDSL